MRPDRHAKSTAIRSSKTAQHKMGPPDSSRSRQLRRRLGVFEPMRAGALGPGPAEVVRSLAGSVALEYLNALEGHFWVKIRGAGSCMALVTG